MEIYYLTMSKEMCERIGAINDENYLVVLKLLAAYHGVLLHPPPCFRPEHFLIEFFNIIIVNN